MPLLPVKPPDKSPPAALWWALGGIALVAFAWFEWITWTQYASQHVYLADAGVFNVLCYGPVHGSFMRNPLAWDLPGNYLGVHFSPALLLVTPFYLIADHIMTLLTLLTASLVVAAIPLGLFAWRMLGSRFLAIAFALLFLLNPFTGSLHLANHPENFTFPALFLAFYALESGKRVLYWAAIAFPMLVKEDYAVYLFLFGLSLTLEKRHRRTGFWTMGVCTAAFMAIYWIMGLFGRGELEEAGIRIAARHGSMGETGGEIILYALTHPFEMLRRFFRPVLIKLLLSAGVLCLLDWRAVWVGLFGAAIFLLTDDPLIRDLWYYYSYNSLPFLFYSSIRGVRTLQRLRERRPAIRLPNGLLGAGIGLLAISLAFTRTHTDNYYHWPFEVTARDRLAARISRQIIPPEAPLAAQYTLFVQVPNRPVLLPLRLENLKEVEWIYLDARKRPPDLPAEEIIAINERLEQEDWELVESLEGYLVYRKANDTPAK